MTKKHLPKNHRNELFQTSRLLAAPPERENEGTLGKVPSRSRSQNITPYCPFFNHYITHI